MNISETIAGDQLNQLVGEHSAPVYYYLLPYADLGS